MKSAERAVVEAALALGDGHTPAFGRLMQEAQKMWRLFLIGQGLGGGGEHSIGPCAGMLVPCQCASEPKPELDDNGHCEWCCGARRVTERVRSAQRAGAR